MSRRPSRFNETVPEVTLTMNNGTVFRPLRGEGRMVLVARNEPVSGTNQSPCRFPINAPAPIPPPPVSQVPEVLEVDV